MTKVYMPLLILLASLAIATTQLQGERRSPTRFDEAIAAFLEADKNNPPEEGGILFIGSSSIRGWRTVTDDFPQHNVINRGFGGSIIADSIHFADRIVLPYKPSLIVFYAGENDLTAGLTPEQVAEDFKEFVSLVHDNLPETTVAFISMKPSPRRARLIETKRVGNDLIREFTQASPRVHYLDVFTPMLDAEGNPRPELFVGDELHLNAQGYALWKAIVGAYLEGLKQ